MRRVLGRYAGVWLYGCLHWDWAFSFPFCWGVKFRKRLRITISECGEFLEICINSPGRTGKAVLPPGQAFPR